MLAWPGRSLQYASVRSFFGKTLRKDCRLILTFRIAVFSSVE